MNATNSSPGSGKAPSPESSANPPPAPIDSSRVATAIARLFGQDRIVLRDEFSLHDALAARLTKAGIEFHREVRMGLHKRPDFVICGIAVELKIGGGAMAILRQLKRYADTPEINGVVLVTTRPVNLPETLGGKPLRGVNLWRNLL